MDLITKEIDEAAREYRLINEEDTPIFNITINTYMMNQKIIAKFFDPNSIWTWYLLGYPSYDPDPDHLWGIIKGHEIEIDGIISDPTDFLYLSEKYSDRNPWFHTTKYKGKKFEEIAKIFTGYKIMMGSFWLSELITFGIKRDLHFIPRKVKEIWNDLVNNLD